MIRFIALGLLSFCLVLSINNQAHAQSYQINNGFAGINPNTDGYQGGQSRNGYPGPRTDPRLGYCLENDCFAGQGPCAPMAAIYGGGCGGCGGNGGSTRIRITIYPGGAGVPPIVQSNCPYCSVRVNPGVYTSASTGRPALRTPG